MFDKLFNANNPFWQSMGSVFDLFILNNLLLFCCIPVVTIGPALTAFYYVLLQRALKEEGYVAKDFFRSFRQNLKQGMVLGLLLTAAGAFLMADMYLCRKSGTGIYTFFLFFFLFIFIFWFFICLYAFPLLAKFERTTKDILLWAFTLSISKLPITLLMAFITIAALWFTRFFPGLIFIVFGLLGATFAPMLTSVLKPYMEQPEEEASISDEELYRAMNVVNLDTINKNRQDQ